jgi:acetyl esterase/lipase
MNKIFTRHDFNVSVVNAVFKGLRCALPLLLALVPLFGCGGQTDRTDAAQSSSPLLLPSLPHVIPYGPNLLQFGVLRVPHGAGPHPVAVVIHGGCWSNTVTLHFNELQSAALTAAGVATWNIEFRRTADPGGGYPNTMLDVGMAVDKLRDLAGPYRLDLARVVTLGHSSGGQLGVWVAARPNLAADDPLRGPNPLPISAVVPLAGVLDLERYYAPFLKLEAPESSLCGLFLGPFMGGSPTEVPQRYAQASPIRLLPIGTRQVLIYGTADNIVPIEQGLRYKEAADEFNEDVVLKQVAGAGHFDLVLPVSPYWPTVQALILKAIHDED